MKDKYVESIGYAFIRSKNTTPNPTDNKRIIALDIKKDSAASKQARTRRLTEHWYDCLSRIRAFRAEEYKAGAAVWDRIGLGVDHVHTRYLLGIEILDEEMTRSIQAALFSALLGASGPVDLEPVVRALATFIHTNPCFAGIVEKTVWSPPFGERTEYTVAEEEDF
jgi:hypothetical protein